MRYKNTLLNAIALLLIVGTNVEAKKLSESEIKSIIVGASYSIKSKKKPSKNSAGKKSTKHVKKSIKKKPILPVPIKEKIVTKKTVKTVKNMPFEFISFSPNGVNNNNNNFVKGFMLVKGQKSSKNLPYKRGKKIARTDEDLLMNIGKNNDNIYASNDANNIDTIQKNKKLSISQEYVESLLSGKVAEN